MVKPPLYKHRTDYGGMKGVVEEQKWGRETARERYGELDYDKKGAPMPPDKSYPQFKEDQRGPDWKDDTANDWRRGANEDATTKPGFDKSNERRR